MTEATRHEIVQRQQTGMSVRAIARELGLTRGAVTRALARVQAQRDRPSPPLPQPRRRGSIVDPFEPLLKELLAKYPNLFAATARQLRGCGGHAARSFLPTPFCDRPGCYEPPLKSGRKPGALLLLRRFAGWLIGKVSGSSAALYQAAVHAPGSMLPPERGGPDSNALAPA